jgi:predicted phosphodiesterase
MRYAILGDIHSNLEAYEAVLAELKDEKDLKYFSVGDIVGYGADPVAAIEITRSLGTTSVCGNHDWAAAGLIETSDFNPNAEAAILWTKDILGIGDIEYLKGLELVYENSDLTLVHGTLNRPEDFDYVLDTYIAYKMMMLAKTKVSFIGHSHIAGIFILEDDMPRYTVKQSITIEPDAKYLVNVGSVGQPRDGDWRAAYCIYDTGKKTLEIRRAEYDVKKAMNKILKAGLPKMLAYRLAEGR